MQILVERVVESVVCSAAAVPSVSSTVNVRSHFVTVVKCRAIAIKRVPVVLECVVESVVCSATTVPSISSAVNVRSHFISVVNRHAVAIKQVPVMLECFVESVVLIRRRSLQLLRRQR